VVRLRLLRAGLLDRDPEQRRLDFLEAVDVAAHSGEGVVEQERLGEADDLDTRND
jgi:hypothetical protein